MILMWMKLIMKCKILMDSLHDVDNAILEKGAGNTF